MFDKIQTALKGPRLKQLLEVRNIGLYIFGIVVLAIAWSGAKTVQNNYGLQKQVAELQQQNAVLSLQNANQALQNQFYETSQYEELSARQNLGLAAPGEKVLLIPQQVALKYVDKNLDKTVQPVTAASDTRPQYVKNLEAWRDFLLGRKIYSD